MHNVKAALWIVVIFCLLGPPVGLLTTFPLLWYAFTMSYVSVGPAFLAGVLEFIFVFGISNSKPVRSVVERGYLRLMGAVLGAAAGPMGLYLNAFMSGGFSMHAANSMATRLLIGSISAGAVCGMISTPRALAFIWRKR